MGSKRQEKFPRPLAAPNELTPKNPENAYFTSSEDPATFLACVSSRHGGSSDRVDGGDAVRVSREALAERCAALG